MSRDLNTELWDMIDTEYAQDASRDRIGRVLDDEDFIYAVENYLIAQAGYLIHHESGEQWQRIVTEFNDKQERMMIVRDEMAIKYGLSSQEVTQALVRSQRELMERVIKDREDLQDDSI